MKDKNGRSGRQRGRSLRKGVWWGFLLLGLSSAPLQGGFSGDGGCQMVFHRLMRLFSLSKVRSQKAFPKPIESLSMRDLDQRVRQSSFSDFALIARRNGYRSPSKLLLESIAESLAAPGSERPSTPGYFRRPGANHSSLELAKALDDLFLRASEGDAEVVGFFKLLGRHAAAQSKVQKNSKPSFGPAPKVEGEFWDLASGVYIEDQFPFLEKDRTYRFFDSSPLVGSFLLALSERWGVKGEVEKKDVLRFPPPQAGTIAAIRSSNASSYIPGLSARLGQMSHWIKPGGQLILQSNSPVGPVRNLKEMLYEHQDLIRNRLSDGWTLQINFSGDYVFDTVVLVRPLKFPDRLPSEEAVLRDWNSLLFAADNVAEHRY